MRHNNLVSALAAIAATGPLAALDIRNLTRPISFLLLSRNTAGTSPTLDVKLQSGTVDSEGYAFKTVGATDNKLKAGASTTVKLAATFTQSGARSISSIALMLNKIGTITAGKLVTVEIQSDTAGAPSGTALGSTTIDIDTLIGTTYAPVIATFATQIDLADATVYHVVLSADYTASSSNCVQWRNATVASGGNHQTYDATNWTATDTKSFELILAQRTYTDVTGGAFTQLATALNTTRQIKTFPAEDLGAYVRGYATIGGTSSPSFMTALEANAEGRRS